MPETAGAAAGAADGVADLAADGDPGDSAAARLAAAQRALVAAVTGTAGTPPGFDSARVELARTSLLAKRAGEVRAAWPALANSIGGPYRAVFAEWAAHRPTRGSLQDGWLLAQERRAAGLLDDAAALELAMREAQWVFDASDGPRRRRGLSVRRLADGTRVIGWRGRVRVR